MKIDTNTWKPFLLHKIMNASMGNGIDANKTSFANPIYNYIGRGASNNGVAGRVDEIEQVAPFPEGSLTLALGGSLGSCFVQTEPFYTAQNVAVLQDKISMNYLTKLFIASIIKLECSVRYHPFGRELNSHFRKDFTIKLPVQTGVYDDSAEFSEDGYVPDWQWMEDYIKSLHHEPIKTKQTANSLSFDVKDWDWFKLGGESGLFDIKKGKRLTAEDQTAGDVPYIGAIDSNNGVSNMIGQKPIHGGNTISLSYNGSVGEAFYQPDSYWATDDVNALYLKPKYGELNPALALFICTVIKLDSYRFSYGRKWTLENMEETMIKIPVAHDGKPDWEWMENYIKSLPYGDRIGWIE